MLWLLRKFAQQESRALFTAGWRENSIFHRMPGIWISSAASQLDYENHFSRRTKKKRDSYRAKLAKLDNRRHMIFSGWKRLFCSPYWICFLNVHLLIWGCGFLVERAMMKIVLLIRAEKNIFLHYLSLIVIAQKMVLFCLHNCHYISYSRKAQSVALVHPGSIVGLGIKVNHYFHLFHKQ